MPLGLSFKFTKNGTAKSGSHNINSAEMETILPESNSNQKLLQSPDSSIMIEDDVIEISMCQFSLTKKSFKIDFLKLNVEKNPYYTHCCLNSKYA